MPLIRYIAVDFYINVMETVPLIDTYWEHNEVIWDRT